MLRVQLRRTINPHSIDIEGKECQQSTKIGKGRINLHEGNQPMLRGTQRDRVGWAFIRCLLEECLEVRLFSSLPARGIDNVQF